MEYRITSSEFWLKCHDLLPSQNSNWHLRDAKIQKVNKTLFGLKYIKTIYDTRIDNPYSSVFVFEILDDKKFLWAKLKYGL